MRKQGSRERERTNECCPQSGRQNPCIKKKSYLMNKWHIIYLAHEPGADDRRPLLDMKKV